MQPSSPFVYNKMIDKLSLEFDRQLDEMSIVYNFDYGPEFEIAVCELLRRILPSRYGICRGFAIDKDGKTAGDDIIIYDTFRSPTLRFLNREDDYARKNQIPVDAVYAYIEAKHTLDSNTFPKAIKQVRSFKRLCYTRLHEYNAAAKAFLKSGNGLDGAHIFDNDYSRINGWNPIVTTPVYSMILSRNYAGMNARKDGGDNDSKEFLNDSIVDYFDRNPAERFDIYNPDSIIVGNHSTAFCACYPPKQSDGTPDTVEITKFYTGVDPLSCYQVDDTGEKSFGLAISHLMMALDYIQLGSIPWDRVFNTAKIPEQEVRDGLVSILNNTLV